MRKYTESQSNLPCSECDIGQMHKTRVTYFTWLGNELITVPDFPAWKCDICGHCEYDQQALDQLALLLRPVQVPSKKRKKARPSNKIGAKRKGIQPAKSK